MRTGRGRGPVALAAAALAVTLTAACGSGGGAAGESVVTVAAAADLRFALEEISALVATQQPGVTMRVTYGSSGQLATQIINGAPYDVFLSADRAYVDRLVDEGLSRADATFDYGVGRLVTWYPQGAPASADGTGLAGLADPSIRTVAIANPEHAPYGRAALAALESAGLVDEVGPKLVLGENVAQAAEFADSGNADAAVVALSLVVAGPLAEDGTWTQVPFDSYPALVQSGTVLTAARDLEAAQAVADVLTSADGREVLSTYGFSLPEPGDATPSTGTP